MTSAAGWEGTSSAFAADWLADQFLERGREAAFGYGARGDVQQGVRANATLHYARQVACP